MVKIPIDSLDTAVLTCPSCGRKKVMQVSCFELTEPETRVRLRCACEKQSEVILKKMDLRSSNLKLPGTYATQGETKQYGRITVKRLNSIGLVFTIIVGRDLPVGQKLLLEFVLDDVKQSIVRKEAIVVATHMRHVSVRFLCPDHFDNLGPYLFFNQLDVVQTV